ncbi:MAG: polysaccharide biosynthesis tyrosine autokinase, partial [Gemmatimonadaceae bacterium]|nr:polysaccharide biosynthesis tyrosine autokinase [Gemmatimonadaceae bacterium]
AILLDLLDKRVRYPDQVNKELDLDIIGAIPLVHPGRPSVEEQAQLVESFRTLRLSLRHQFAAGEPVSFTVTSTGPSEGKSFVSSNLALSFAEAGFRTVLVDGDTRRGAIQQAFNVPQKPGLVDFLMGTASLDDVVYPTSYDRLALVPCGSRHRQAPEMVTTAAMESLLDELRARYDVVICDSPPLGAGTDGYALATLTGGLLMVLRIGMTDRKMAVAKLQTMDRLPIRPLGAVLNGIEPKGVFQYYHYLEGYTSSTSPDDDGEPGACTSATLQKSGWNLVEPADSAAGIGSVGGVAEGRHGADDELATCPPGRIAVCHRRDPCAELAGAADVGESRPKAFGEADCSFDRRVGCQDRELGGREPCDDVGATRHRCKRARHRGGDRRGQRLAAVVATDGDCETGQWRASPCRVGHQFVSAVGQGAVRVEPGVLLDDAITLGIVASALGRDPAVQSEEEKLPVHRLLPDTPGPRLVALPQEVTRCGGGGHHDQRYLRRNALLAAKSTADFQPVEIWQARLDDDDVGRSDLGQIQCLYARVRSHDCIAVWSQNRLEGARSPLLLDADDHDRWSGAEVKGRSRPRHRRRPVWSRVRGRFAWSQDVCGRALSA